MPGPNAGPHATLPTAGIINKIWAGNETSTVDLSLPPAPATTNLVTPPASGFFGVC